MKYEPNRILIETERLKWRQFELGDADFLIQLFNSNGWIENIGDRKIYTKLEAEKYIKNHFWTLYRQYTFGFGIIISKESNQPIGMCGITKRDFLECPDLGFAFLDEHTGKGYAFEIAASLCDAVKKDNPKISIITNSENKACLRLAEKLNFKLEKTYYEAFFLAEVSLLHLTYQNLD